MSDSAHTSKFSLLAPNKSLLPPPTNHPLSTKACDQNKNSSSNQSSNVEESEDSKMDLDVEDPMAPQSKSSSKKYEVIKVLKCGQCANLYEGKAAFDAHCCDSQSQANQSGYSSVGGQNDSTEKVELGETNEVDDDSKLDGVSSVLWSGFCPFVCEEIIVVLSIYRSGKFSLKNLFICICLGLILIFFNIESSPYISN